MKNWKTTLLGLLAFVGVIISVVVSLLDGNPATNPDWTYVYTQLMVFIALFKAADALKPT